MPFLNINNIAAIILSGGQGSRLAGKDKGLQIYNGKALVAWVIQAVSPQVGTTILSINRNLDIYKKYKLSTVIDESNGSYNGPIAGILSASKTLKTKSLADQAIDYILTTTCDSPNLPHNYVSELYQRIIGSDLDAVIVNDGQRRQNLHCLIRASSIEKLRSYYDDGGRSMHGWFLQIKYAEVDFSAQSKYFLNINTEQDLAE